MGFEEAAMFIEKDFKNMKLFLDAGFAIRIAARSYKPVR
jgi:hypothetical protein